MPKTDHYSWVPDAEWQRDVLLRFEAAMGDDWRRFCSQVAASRIGEHAWNADPIVGSFSGHTDLHRGGYDDIAFLSGGSEDIEVFLAIEVGHYVEGNLPDRSISLEVVVTIADRRPRVSRARQSNDAIVRDIEPALRSAFRASELTVTEFPNLDPAPSGTPRIWPTVPIRKGNLMLSVGSREFPAHELEDRGRLVREAVEGIRRGWKDFVSIVHYARALLAPLDTVTASDVVGFLGEAAFACSPAAADAIWLGGNNPGFDFSRGQEFFEVKAQSGSGRHTPTFTRVELEFGCDVPSSWHVVSVKIPEDLVKRALHLAKSTKTRRMPAGVVVPQRNQERLHIVPARFFEWFGVAQSERPKVLALIDEVASRADVRLHRAPLASRWQGLRPVVPLLGPRMELIVDGGERITD